MKKVLIFQIILLMLVTYNLQARTCAGGYMQEEGSFICSYINTLIRLPGYDSCRSNKLNQINQSRSTILESRSLLTTKNYDKEICIEKTTGLINTLNGNEKLLEANKELQKSIKGRVAICAVSVKRADSRLSYIRKIHNQIITALPDLITSIENHLNDENSLLENEISELEGAIQIEVDPTKRTEFQIKIDFLKDISLFTDYARIKYPDISKIESIKKLMAESDDKSSEELKKLVRPSSIGLLKLVATFKNSITDDEIYNSLVKEEEEHLNFLKTERHSGEIELQTVTNKIAEIEQTITTNRNDYFNKTSECSLISVSILNLNSLIKQSEDSIPGLEQDVRDCDETQTSCEYRRSGCRHLQPVTRPGDRP